MLEAKAEAKVSQLLSTAGIGVDGEQPWDMRVHDKRLYRRILRDPSLGLGESYIEGLWDCERLDVFFFRLMRSLHGHDIYKVWTFLRHIFINALSNQQARHRAAQVANVHYNIDNDLFERMLGESMAYTCAYWDHAETLDKAQTDKYDLVCRKLELKPGEKLLDLGCGWGGFANFAAENYDVSVVAVNIAREQVEYGRRHFKNAAITFFNCDYRDIKQYNPSSQRFDKIASIGMCEHVGHKNYATLVRTVREQLKDEGLFLLHTIAKNHTTSYSDPWIQKYIFPNGMLPTMQLLTKALESDFVIEDVHNFGASYDKTLMVWCERFEKYWPEISVNYDEKFYRTWRYYLLSCAGAFRARSMQLYQLVVSPYGQLNGYRSVR